MSTIKVQCIGPEGQVINIVEYPANPTREDILLDALRELAERTRGQLLDLVRNPTPERCGLMVRALAEVSTQVHRLGSELESYP